MTKEDEELSRHLLQDLKEIAKMIGEFQLTPEAVAWGAAWYESHWKHRPAHLNHPQMEGYVARKQTHIHKLAMILSAAEASDLIITAEQLENANKIIGNIEAYMTKAYAKVSDNTGAKHLDKLLTILRAVGKPVPRETLWRNVSGFMQFRDFEHSLLGAQQAGFIRLAQEGQTIVIIPLPSLLTSH
jgi:hypothetical protein